MDCEIRGTQVNFCVFFSLQDKYLYGIAKGELNFYTIRTLNDILVSPLSVYVNRDSWVGGLYMNRQKF